jgi:hypothetical protein
MLGVGTTDPINSPVTGTDALRHTRAAMPVPLLDPAAFFSGAKVSRPATRPGAASGAIDTRYRRVSSALVSVGSPESGGTGVTTNAGLNETRGGKDALFSLSAATSCGLSRTVSRRLGLSPAPSTRTRSKRRRGGSKVMAGSNVPVTVRRATG